MLNQGEFEPAYGQYLDALRISRTTIDSLLVYMSLEQYYTSKGQTRKALEAFEMSSITVLLPFSSRVVVMKFFGLFSKIYSFFSGLRSRPSNLTSSISFTLYPISVIGFPFTVTFPAAMYTSASLREQTPALARYLLRRINSFSCESVFFVALKREVLEPLKDFLGCFLRSIWYSNKRQRYKCYELMFRSLNIISKGLKCGVADLFLLLFKPEISIFTKQI